MFSNDDKGSVYYNFKFHDPSVKIMYNFDVMMCIISTHFEKLRACKKKFRSALISAILTHFEKKNSKCVVFSKCVVQCTLIAIVLTVAMQLSSSIAGFY